MWSLRQRPDGTFYLTYDHSRRYSTSQLRGLWELVGPQEVTATNKAVQENKKQGYTHCNDDEGNVRVLVLEY